MADLYDLGINDLTQNLRRTLTASTVDMLEQGGGNIQNIAKYFKAEAENKEKIAAVHRNIASHVREAVLEAYNQNVVAKRVAPSYRRGDEFRDAGKLGPALKRKSMYIGDSEGVSFINTSILDSEARHWARLNFGASPNIGNTVGAFPARTGRIRFGRGVGISLRFAEGPGESFGVPNVGQSGRAPRGFFNDQNQLFLRGQFPSKKNGIEGVVVTGKLSQKGIGARRFLDAGLVALGANYGPEFRQHFEDARREAVDRARREKVAAGGRDYQLIYARRKANPASRYFRG